MLVATDGACKGNPGPGTWAFAVFNSKEKYVGHKKGSNKLSTNNEMELTAIKEALNWAEKFGHPIHILTDSQYCLTGITKWAEGWAKRGWKTSSGTQVKNIELWKEVMASKANFTIEKVKGHSGNKFNDMADLLCNEEYLNVFL